MRAVEAGGGPNIKQRGEIEETYELLDDKEVSSFYSLWKTSDVDIRASKVPAADLHVAILREWIRRLGGDEKVEVISLVESLEVRRQHESAQGSKRRGGLG